MQVDLKGKSILLGVTGSISAYKACDIARLFVKAGAQVHVVMTASSERFVSALTFEALTRNPVLTDTSESWSSDLNHIDIGKKCDLFLISPCSANTINKLSQGIADNILTQTALAFTKEMLIAPAANTYMLSDPATLKSIQTLRDNNVTIIEAQEKLLACGDVGSGALAEPSEVFYAAARTLLKESFWENRQVVVTGGGSREKIDEVRYISNFSSGKMAKSLCLALYLKGADVSYITSMGAEGLPLNIKVKHFEDAEALLEQTQMALDMAKINSSQEPYLFMVAAVADFKPKSPKKGKLKKSALGEIWNVELTQNPDVLSTLKRDGVTTIGFKAEMDNKEGLNNAVKLLTQKSVDAVCYNLLKDAKSFGGDENEITFITKDTQIPLGRADKLSLSFNILTQSKELSSE
ncbi:MAG: Phosphopantothenoylcysteine decarboxylase (EC / Phosphopantothenoylcysteine synthetase (EC [uncultured Sulfurovum sp.]|uniref:Coenzyme A biosynthesis bifunctional protein CoaBC n=1 Tax=uncultured Sulfurovum sp. TaxID=269237 RepID=A0A6S6SG36_9BACT|nr:MAG: Phosphopantothenoylcysteine decarboxylase (EC / Phosphopantothenoylcysteine synthetase (EC [uncultured Sulfurovum sp.]